MSEAFSHNPQGKWVCKEQDANSQVEDTRAKSPTADQESNVQDQISFFFIYDKPVMVRAEE